jgi:hypothetical protein
MCERERRRESQNDPVHDEEEPRGTDHGHDNGDSPDKWLFQCASPASIDPLSSPQHALASLASPAYQSVRD